MTQRAPKTPKTKATTKPATSSKGGGKPKAPVAEAMTDVDTSSAPRAASAKPSVIAGLSPVVVGNELRKKELFELVVERTGMKKKDVKPVVEAMLAVLGEALAEHREMQLQPLGKLKVQRGRELADGRALVLKLRQKTGKLDAAKTGAPTTPARPSTATE